MRVALLFQTPGLAAATQDIKTYALNDVVLGPYNDLRIRRAIPNTHITARVNGSIHLHITGHVHICRR